MTQTATYLLVALIYIIAYIYSIEFAPRIAGATTGWQGCVNAVHESCVAGCHVGMCQLSVRGSNYYIGSTDAAKAQALDQCLVTFWGLSHFLLYSVLGFVAPHMFWETFAVGVAFEIYEAHTFDCHDTFDVVLNTAGFFAGRFAWGVVSRRSAKN